MSTENKRDETFDLVKFAAIFMVIMWHCYPSGWHASTDGCIDSVAVNAIIGCNMPLFFMISGYFARRMYATCDWRLQLIRLVGYLWPVMIFSIVDVGVAFIHDAHMHFTDRFFHSLIFCFWFFCCLTLCELTTFGATYVAKVTRVNLAIILSLIFLVFWSIPYGVYYYIAMVPFYWIGCFALPQLYEKKIYL